MLRDDEKIITDEKKLVQPFNDHCISIAEWSCGFKPEKVELDICSDKKMKSYVLFQTNTKITLVLQKCIKIKIYNPFPYLHLLPVGVLR